MAEPTTPPLFKLPPELRNRIYHEALLSPTAVHVTSPTAEPIWQSPGILKTCRQLRGETSAIYYSGNTFLVRSNGCDADDAIDPDGNPNGGLQDICIGSLIRWLEALSRSTRAELRNVYLDDRFYDKVEYGKNSIAHYRAILSAAGLKVDQCLFWIEMGWSEADGGHQWFAGGGHFRIRW